jgi:hypothetical protein
MTFLPSVNGGWWCSGCGSTVRRIGMVYICLVCSSCTGNYNADLLRPTYASQPACGEWDGEDAGVGEPVVVDGEQPGKELR